MRIDGLLTQIKRRVPVAVKRRAKRIVNAGSARYCPCCRSSVRAFREFGRPPRARAQCPVCGSLERHRLAQLVLDRQRLVGRAPGEVLYHFSPEPVMVAALRSNPDTVYVSADLEPGSHQQLDLCNLALDDDSVDVIFCSHVLEHVADDAAAMREIARVLRPGGRAILMVPQRSGPTYEDPSIVDPEQRHRAFGQWDHVRFYGDDFVDRLRAASLDVSVTASEDLGDQRFRERHGLTEWERVYVATPSVGG